MLPHVKFSLGMEEDQNMFFEHDARVPFFKTASFLLNPGPAAFCSRVSTILAQISDIFS